MARKNVIIIGAAGRDFHNFNMVYRGNKDYNNKQYPNIGTLLPANGYGAEMVKDL